jgi:4'-phosphopantetheinyl transferase
MSPLALYWFRLDVDAAPDERSWLSPEERARAARFIVPMHGRRYQAAHIQLRRLLGRELGQPPAAIEFAFGSNGKPELVHSSSLHFNLSHSGDIGLIGISRERELGVDVEAERPTLDGLGIAHRFFTANETAWLAALAPVARVRGFCRLWTCKEAWMKSGGQGMSLPLDRAEVTLDGAAPARLKVQGDELFVRELDLLPGYCAAVVMARAPESLTLEPAASAPAPAPPAP